MNKWVFLSKYFCSIKIVYLQAMAKGKNQLVHINMPVILYDMIARESFQTSTSKQEILRQIVRAHYSKKYGKDVYLEREEIKL